MVGRKLADIPRGFRFFPAPLRSDFLEVPIGTSSEVAPCGTEKQLETRRRGIPEMGSVAETECLALNIILRVFGKSVGFMGLPSSRTSTCIYIDLSLFAWLIYCS